MTIVEWLFGPTMIVDPQLGTLRRTGDRWAGRSDQGLSFDIGNAGRRLAPQLRAAMVEALANRAILERMARTYLESDPRAVELEVGAVSHISVNLAPSDWISRTLAADVNRSDTNVNPGDIIVSLEFSLDGDRNNVEVIFRAGRVVTSDYH